MINYNTLTDFSSTTI